MTILAAILEKHGFIDPQQQIDIIRLMQLAGCFKAEQLKVDLEIAGFSNKEITEHMKQISDNSEGKDKNFAAKLLKADFFNMMADMSTDQVSETHEQELKAKIHDWLIKVTQRVFFGRAAGVERWQVEASQWLENAEPEEIKQIIARLKIAEEEAPKALLYDGMGINGGGFPRMLHRVNYSKTLVNREKNPVQVKQLYGICGERPADYNIDTMAAIEQAAVFVSESEVDAVRTRLSLDSGDRIVELVEIRKRLDLRTFVSQEEVQTTLKSLNVVADERRKKIQAINLFVSASELVSKDEIVEARKKIASSLSDPKKGAEGILMAISQTISDSDCIKTIFAEKISSQRNFTEADCLKIAATEKLINLRKFDNIPKANNVTADGDKSEAQKFKACMQIARIVAVTEKHLLQHAIKEVAGQAAKENSDVFSKLASAAKIVSAPMYLDSSGKMVRPDTVKSLEKFAATLKTSSNPLEKGFRKMLLVSAAPDIKSQAITTRDTFKDTLSKEGYEFEVVGGKIDLKAPYRSFIMPLGGALFGNYAHVSLALGTQKTFAQLEAHKKAELGFATVAAAATPLASTLTTKTTTANTAVVVQANDTAASTSVLVNTAASSAEVLITTQVTTIIVAPFTPLKALQTQPSLNALASSAANTAATTSTVVKSTDTATAAAAATPIATDTTAADAPVAASAAEAGSSKIKASH